jgi:hypothetical protein
MAFPTTCYGINLEQFKKPVYWTLVQYEERELRCQVLGLGKGFLILTPEH